MVKNNVIWVASYPKSGNTWIHSVIRKAGQGYGFAQASIDVYKIQKNGSKPEPCPAVEEEYACNPCVVLKTHAPYQDNEQLHRFDDIELVNSGFVYIYRNPLDILLSAINYSRFEYEPFSNEKYKERLFLDFLGFKKVYDFDEWRNMTLDSIPQRNLDHALDCFSEALHLHMFSGVARGSWIEHIQSWIKADESMKGITLRYEDCLKDDKQFVRLVEFFKFREDDVLEALNWANDRARRISRDSTSHDSIFFNKMTAYYFMDYFSKPAIHRFMKKNEDVLIRSGYSSLLTMV